MIGNTEREGRNDGYHLSYLSVERWTNLKAFRFGEQEVETAEPVRQDQQDVNEVDDPPEVGVNRSGFNNVVAVHRPVHLWLQIWLCTNELDVFWHWKNVEIKEK